MILLEEGYPALFFCLPLCPESCAVVCLAYSLLNNTFVFPTFVKSYPIMLWRILDIFFVIFHTSLIVFNLFGWIWKKTRILNLVVLSLTGASWLFLGLIVGTLGYCPLTDWHFRVLEKLGETNIPDSYIKYLADRLTGLDINASLINNVTLYVFLAAFSVSVFLNVKDYKTS